MRRSAAPSFKDGIKRARFLPQIIKNISLSDKENECHPVSSVNISSTTPETSNSFFDTGHETTMNIESKRSNEDVLHLIFEADASAVEDTKKANILSASEEINADNSPKNFKACLKSKPEKSSTEASLPNKTIEEYKNLSDCIFCTKLIEEASFFNVVWCKRSGKKHKTWEGDGLLIVKSRSAVLKDLTGKILEKSLGYKLKETESLEEGGKFFIGGKECEIQYKISKEECQSGTYCKCTSSTESSVKQHEKLPVNVHKPC